MFERQIEVLEACDQFRVEDTDELAGCLLRERDVMATIGRGENAA